MERMFLLRNPVQRYAWGSRDAIPRILGLPPIPEGEAPWAELWMGAHPSAPSRVELPGAGEIGLDQLAARNPDEVLGARVAGAFGGRLPFLFKIIAAARPLSLQCHPDAAAARAGFERENRLGLPLAAPERNYRDPSHKPELMVALGRFEALVGFRPGREIRERLAAAGAAVLEPAAAELDRSGGQARFLSALLRLDPRRRRELLDKVADAIGQDESREAAWVRRLIGDYPGDPAALAPLFLNFVELAADQGLYLGAGVLHAYLTGVGLEIMASSDNVLRGGLTGKHIDVDELCAVVADRPAPPTVLVPSTADGRVQTYRTPAAEFQLGFLDFVSAGCHDRVRGEGAGPEIFLNLAERCRLIDHATGAALDLQRGSAVLVTAQVAAYRAEGEGGRVYVAGVP